MQLVLLPVAKAVAQPIYFGCNSPRLVVDSRTNYSDSPAVFELALFEAAVEAVFVAY